MHIKVNLSLSVFILLFAGAKPSFGQGVFQIDSAKCVRARDTATGIEYMKNPEKAPEFKGGTKALLQYIQRHFDYDHSGLKRMNILPYLCIIGPDGSVLSASILFNPGVDEALIARGIRFIKKLPKFEPGTCGGQPVAVQMSMPIMVRP